MRARLTCWLADGVSPAGLSRRGHLRPAEGTWLGEFRPTEQGQAGRRARGAGAAAAVGIIQGAGSESRKLGKSLARSWGAAVAEVSSTGWPPGTLGIATRGFPPRSFPEGERSVARDVLSELSPRLSGFGPLPFLEPTAREDRVPCEAETRRWPEPPVKPGFCANLSAGFPCPRRFPAGN